MPTIPAAEKPTGATESLQSVASARANFKVELHHSHFSPVRSGMERKIHYLASEFRQLGLQVTVVASQQGVDAVYPYEQKGFRIAVHPDYFVRKPFSLFDRLIYINRLTCFMRSRPAPDLVVSLHHAYVVAARKAWPAVPILYLPGQTLWDWTRDQYGFAGFRNRWAVMPVKCPLGWFAESLALRMATETLVQSDYLARRFRRLYPWLGNIHCRPVAVDTKRFRPDVERRAAFRRELGISDETRVILAIGRLDGNKNYKTLLRAARQLKASNWIIVIAGTGPEENELRQAAVNLPVRFLGVRSDPEYLYSAADIYTQLSFQESHSNTVREAIASGVPSIISAEINRGLTDGLNVVLADPYDVAEWARKIDLLLADATFRSRLSTAARSFADSRPTWSDLAQWLLARVVRQPG